METKRCPHCEQDLPIDKFSLLASGKRYNTCKDCKAQQMREYRRIRKSTNSFEEVCRVKEYHRNRMMSSAKRNDRGWDVEIVKEDIIIPDHCFVFGHRFDYESEGRTDWSPSLDRIDNSKGYVRGNIIVVSWKANRIKNQMSLEQITETNRLYEGGKPTDKDLVRVVQFYSMISDVGVESPDRIRIPVDHHDIVLALVERLK